MKKRRYTGPAPSNTLRAQAQAAQAVRTIVNKAWDTTETSAVQRQISKVRDLRTLESQGNPLATFALRREQIALKDMVERGRRLVGRR